MKLVTVRGLDECPQSLSLGASQGVDEVSDAQFWRWASEEIAGQLYSGICLMIRVAEARRLVTPEQAMRLKSQMKEHTRLRRWWRMLVCMSPYYWPLTWEGNAQRVRFCLKMSEACEEGE
jgi:hypothetical protein